MQSVGEFQGLHEFWQHWNYLPHANPRTLFESPDSKIKVIVENINQSIEAIGLFEDKSKPIWDDPSNKSSSKLYFDLDAENIDRLKDMWDRLAFSLIGETMHHSEEIIGSRVLDKKTFYRFEIWCKFDASLARFSDKTSLIQDSIRDVLGNIQINVASHNQT